jgi:hypothetical protein
LTIGGVSPQAAAQKYFGLEARFFRFLGPDRMHGDMIFIAGVPLKISNIQPTTSSV